MSNYLNISEDSSVLVDSNAVYKEIMPLRCLPQGRHYSWEDTIATSLAIAEFAKSLSSFTPQRDAEFESLQEHYKTSELAKFFNK